jgi:hypothetical protein
MGSDARDSPSRVNLPTAGRGLPGGKFLFLFRQEKEPKEGDPDIPEISDTQRCRVGGAVRGNFKSQVKSRVKSKVNGQDKSKVKGDENGYKTCF